MSSTLKEALIQAGDEKQVELLSPDAQSLTESEIENFMNGKDADKISDSIKSSLTKLAKTRVKDGQSVMPFHLKNLEVNESDDNIGGGFW